MAEEGEAQQQGGGGGEGGDKGGDAAQKQGGGGLSTPILIGIMAAVMGVMMVGGFALAWFVLPAKISASLEEKIETKTKKSDSEHGEEKDAHGESAKEEEGSHGETKEGGGAHGEGGGGSATTVEDFILSEVLVNVAGTRGARYVKASIFFEGPPHVRKELEAQRPKVIDLVSQVLSSKSLDQLTADDGRAILRAEILKVVNSLLLDDKVENIYFLDYIIQ